LTVGIDLYKALVYHLHDEGYKVGLGWMNEKDERPLSHMPKATRTRCVIVNFYPYARVWIMRSAENEDRLGYWYKKRLNIDGTITVRGSKNNLLWKDLGDIHDPELIPTLMTALQEYANATNSSIRSPL